MFCWKKISVLATLSLGLVACSTKLIGSAADRPAVIAQVHVISDNPGNRTTVAIERNLKEHDIQLTQNAPVVLELTNMTYSHPFPDQINAGVAFTTTATLSATYRLTTASGEPIQGDTTVSASQSLFHNANQVNTTSMDNIFLRTLSRKLASSIYYRLSATNTTKRIEKILGQGQKHAAKRH